MSQLSQFPSAKKIAVLKFGSSILTEAADVKQIVHEVYRYLRVSYHVLVIISAIGNTTNELVDAINNIFNSPIENPDPKDYAQLLATGELAAASLVNMGLNHAGIPAFKLDHRYLHTQGSVIDADPCALEKEKLLALFTHHPVLVMPGFIGCHATEGLTLLGRGGSDFSAIFIAAQLGADECVLYKDTDGIFTDDPNLCGVNVHKYKTLHYDECLQVAYPVVQYKAVKFAQNHGFAFKVKALGSHEGTWVGNFHTATYPPRMITAPKKLKILLLGLGNVGYGVYQHLIAAQESIEIVGIGVKNLAKHQQSSLQAFLSTDLSELIKRDYDIVIELIGGTTLAYDLILAALRKKRHVITANKHLLAEKGQFLQQVAAENGSLLLYSAAVGGAVPVLETIAQLKQQDQNQSDPITSVTGILNGTCNFILEKMTAGLSLADSIALAQAAGFAESDPSFDIDGIDIAHKLILIARQAFAKEIDDLQIEGLSQLSEKMLEKLSDKNKVLKLIAHCHAEQDKIKGIIKPIFLRAEHDFSQINGANNCVLIQKKSGQSIWLSGKGAGRFPTAQAVFADLLDILENMQNGYYAHFHNDQTIHTGRYGT